MVYDDCLLPLAFVDALSRCPLPIVRCTNPFLPIPTLTPSTSSSTIHITIHITTIIIIYYSILTNRLGNEAFSAKNYEEAIRFYTSAIQADGTNHVFYSNRSACYASQTKWQLAANDAKECIKLDPTFIKGYYRLATAQTELDHLDAATATIKQGLNIDNTNPQLIRQLHNVKQAQKRKKAAAMRTTTAATSNAAAAASSSGISNELQELHQAYIQSIRESKTVEANIAMAQREYKAQQLTKTELEQLPSQPQDGSGSGSSGGSDDDTTKMYRSIGKMFLRASRSDIMEHIDKTMEAEQKKEADFTKKQQYLEKRIQSQQQNIQELLPASASRNKQ
jgi:tetratricopeptide (TPR) repeat protein